MQIPSIHIRKATPGDTPILAQHRSAMFRDMALGTDDGHATMIAHFTDWAATKMQRNELFAWVACDEDNIVAGGVLMLLDWAADPFGSTDPRAYIYNIYTEPTYRRQGIARRIMDVVLEDCRARGIKYVGLHASEFGRPLYEKMGFTATNEMRIKLE